MNSINKRIVFLSLRYCSILLIGAIVLFSEAFYNLLLPPTIYSTNFILNLFYPSFVFNDILLIQSFAIKIIPACVGVSAYFLLIILNLSVSMSCKKRIFSLILSLFSFFVINLIRIAVLSLMLINNFSNFELIHKTIWFVLSIILVFLIWVAEIFFFKIKSVPFYSDTKFLKELQK